MQPIKAIFFDYFGVISSIEFWRTVSTDQRLHGVFGELSEQVNDGSMPWHTFVAKIAELTGKSPAEVQRLYLAEQLNPEVLAIADSLHDHYKTGIITNASDDFLMPILEKAGLDKVFDSVTVSSVVGVAKPHAKIYERACAVAGIEPENCVFIDDAAANVDGAIRCGMRGIVYQDVPRLKLDLAKLGVY